MAYEALDGMQMVTQVDELTNCADMGLKWSFFICLLSFSAILLLDKVIFNNSDIADSNSHLSSRSRTSNLRKSLIKNNEEEDEMNMENNFKERVSSKYKLALKLSRNGNLDNDKEEEDSVQFSKPSPKLIKNQNDEEESNNLTEELINGSNETNSNNKEKRVLKDQTEYLQVNVIRTDDDVKGDMVDTHHHEGHVHQNLVKKGDSFLTCIVLLFAMGIHGFFSMLAFGLETTKTGTVNLFIALIVHKWSEAFTVSKDTL
jgi:hypothetical protein